MIPLLLALTCINLVSLLTTAALGYGVLFGRDWGSYHQLAGVLATICCCTVHCIVFTYFIATAKWVQHAVTVKDLSPSMLEPTRSFRAQAFPAALLAMMAVFLTAVIGVATFSYHLNPIYHRYAAIASVIVNVVAAWIEYLAISRNGRLIDGVLAQINAKSV